MTIISCIIGSFPIGKVFVGATPLARANIRLPIIEKLPFGGIQLSGKTWTFITNHGAVLALVGQSKTITTREIASRLGITERTVLRIIKDLESTGYIQKKKDGRVNRYTVNRELPLRRPDQRDNRVAELLEILKA